MPTDNPNNVKLNFFIYIKTFPSVGWFDLSVLIQMLIFVSWNKIVYLSGLLKRS